MITKVSYRPYAQGVSNTQNQKQKVNFGMTATEQAAKAFADKVAQALSHKEELVRIVRFDEAVQALLMETHPGTPSGDLLSAIRKAICGY